MEKEIEDLRSKYQSILAEACSLYSQHDDGNGSIQFWVHYERANLASAMIDDLTRVLNEFTSAKRN